MSFSVAVKEVVGSMMVVRGNLRSRLEDLLTQEAELAVLKNEVSMQGLFNHSCSLLIELPFWHFLCLAFGVLCLW